ncbi:SprT-like domain-containing protein [Halomicrococcus sp. SG-WS-1]|uniref:SprT-like domain-containing protein n=1 Tax=Halomicrococcus sp. SG-WS-1 TaxID=3439057 RepID=UPI003F7AD0AA
MDWEVFQRAQRQAGVTEDNPDTEAATIRLTWDAYQEFGWTQFSKTFRHELVHAWQYRRFDEADHGETFVRWTDPLNIA